MRPRLGTFAVTTALPTTPYDVPGAGTVSFVLPSGLAGGTHWITLTGGLTGTVAKVPVSVTDTRADSTVSGTAADITWGDAGSVDVTVTPSTATGTVELYDGDDADRRRHPHGRRHDDHRDRRRGAGDRHPHPHLEVQR